MVNAPDDRKERRERRRSGLSFSSVQLYFAAVVIFAIVPVVALFSYSITEQRRSAVAEVARDARLHATLIAREASQLVEGSRQVLRVLAELPAVQQRDSVLCTRLFADLLKEFDAYDNFGLIGNDGGVIASGRPRPASVNLSDRAYFRIARETRDFSIGEYQVGRITGTPTINFGYPVLDRDGEVVAVVYAALNLNWLNRHAATFAAGLPPGSTLTEVDREGVVLVRIPDPEKWVGKRLPENRVYRAAPARTDGIIETRDIDGGDRISAFAAIGNSSRGNDVLVIIDMCPEVVFAELNRFVLRYSLISGLIAVFLGGAIWISGRFFFRRPLAELMDATNRISAGETGSRARVARGVSELKRLAEAFNRMAATLERDESGRKAAEEEKRQLHVQLAQAGKMEAIGSLTGGIAHDFNNVLLAIKGNVELAMAKTQKHDPVYDDLIEIHAASERASRLTHQLLVFGRRQPLQQVPVDLNAVVGSMAQMLERTLGENIRVSVEREEELPFVMGDRGSIEQVILNLALNARDAMSAGGALTVRTASAHFDFDFCKTHSEVIPGPYACLSVSDTGCGMAPEVMSKIFEPFFTTKSEGQNSGWGLAIVYGIVKQQNGWINVESVPGKGSTFTVCFPVSGERVTDEPEVLLPLPDLAGRGERILVVEDDRAVRDLVKRVLAVNGYAVREAAAAQEALRILEIERGSFRLVLADIILPDTDGLTLAERIAVSDPETRVLLMSGYVGETSRWEEIRSSGFHFLQKPFSILALLRAVRGALGAPVSR